MGNNNKLQRLSNHRNETIDENFESTCNLFLQNARECEVFSDLTNLMNLYLEICNEFSESKKNFFFSNQIHIILMNYFIDPSKIDKDCQIFLPFLLVTLYEKFETECDFFLKEEFLAQLIKEATTLPTITDERLNKRYQNRLLRINKLLKELIKKYPESFSFPFIINQYIESIQKVHHFHILKSFCHIIKHEQATFDLCIQIYPYLNTIFDPKNTHYLERVGFARLSIILLKKGIHFQQYFCENIEIKKLFEIFIEIDEYDNTKRNDYTEFILLGTEIFNIYTILIAQEKKELAELAFNTIDQSLLFEIIIRIYNRGLNITDFFVAVCHFYQTLLTCFPQTLDCINIDLIKLLLIFCDSSYKLEIEAILTLSMICCSGKVDLIQFLIENGLIEKIISVIDENQMTIVFMKSLKMIFDYSISTNNQEIQNEIFQESFFESINNIIQKTEFKEIEIIWQSILETRKDLFI